MNLGGSLLHAGLTAALLLVSGYAVSGWFAETSRGLRLLVAPVAGFALQLWSVSVINLMLPLGPPAAWLVLWPVVLVLAVRPLRRTLGRDLRGAGTDPRGRAVLAGAAALMLVLLLPLLCHPDLVFFDGTSNHDNFFWVTGAEYLQGQLYSAVRDARELPLRFAAVVPILGLHPAWGRMGAEGWVAAMSGLTGVSPLTWYVGGTTALALPWITTTLALVRAIGWLPRSPLWLGLACALQPLLVFFLTNGNLPNLAGALCGGALLVAAHAACSASRAERRLALVLLPLLLHGLLVTYPEIAPFAGLPAAMVVMARTMRPQPGTTRRQLMLTLGLALLAGLVLNPVTTWRASIGFLASFAAARADGGWPNIFAELLPVSFLPASLTLSIDTLEYFQPYGSAACTALLAIALAVAWWRARDRLLATAAVTGFACLAAYTIFTDFSYGWQKASQFAAVPLAAWYPFGAAFPWQRRGISALAVAGVAACWIPAAWGLVDQAEEATRVAEQKGITSSMLTLRHALREQAPGNILVLGESFRMPFFQSMWATYVLPEDAIVFDHDETTHGGYVADEVPRIEVNAAAPRVTAFYLGRAWADAFCPDLERTAQDRLFALLPRINHVRLGDGFLPRHDAQGVKGVPTIAAARFSLTLRPVGDATLAVRLRAFDRNGRDWVAHGTVHSATTSTTFAARTSGDGALRLTASLRGGVDNLVEVRLEPAAGTTVPPPEHPFAVEEILVRTSAAGAARP